MKNYVENDVFNFGNTDVNFDYSVENKDSQNVDWFTFNSNNNINENTEVVKNDSLMSNTSNQGDVTSSNFNDFNSTETQTNNYLNNLMTNAENPFVTSNSVNIVDDVKEELGGTQNSFDSFNNPYSSEVLKANDVFGINLGHDVVSEPVEDIAIQTVEEQPTMESFTQEVSEQPVEDTSVQTVEEHPTMESFTQEVNEQPVEDKSVQTTEEQPTIESFTQEVNEQPVEDTTTQVIEEIPQRNIQMSDTDLSNLTSFKEEALETTDIKSLFDRVGINVKEASDIFKKNTEMKEKIDSRFEELKKLQLEVSKSKQEQYDEINSYKEEVLSKLTEKKDEIERRLNKLKDFQTSLEKEKEEFEKYRKQQNEEIERVQKEVQDAYDSRREELKKVEDVLRNQKDALDEERNQLSLDKIQYESDKNELANNLLKFNEIVDSFTKGIEKIDKE